MNRSFLEQWIVANKHEEWKCLRRTAATVPLVSVVIPTYQHADIIEQCVESVIAQRTTFPFELIIGEDGSSDGTRELVESLCRKYPEQITAIFQPRTNNFSINGRPTGRFNLLVCFKEAQGKYIAWCDGDDYFIDESKLARQVDCLESNTELIGVWTDYVSRGAVSFRPKATVGAVFGEEAVWPKNQLGASTTMIRREALNYIDRPVMTEAEFLDITFWIRLFKIEGLKGGYIHEPMVNYTLHDNSFFSSMNPEEQMRRGFQVRLQAICGELIDRKDFEDLVDAFESNLKVVRRTNRWGVRHLLQLHWFRKLLQWWKFRNE